MEKVEIIKVCGMTEPGNIMSVDALGVDLIGMLFYPKSPRYVVDKITDSELFFSVLKKVKAKKTGVFVNETKENLLRYASEFGLDYLQLHGSETPELCRELKEQGFRLIKALNIRSAEDFRKCEEYAPYVDYFVFDTPCAGHGGSGRKFNWQLLDSYKTDRPFLLSGGIGKDDAMAVFEISNPSCAGVDLNSKFETAPGIKDAEMLSRFISQIKNKEK